MTVNQKIASLLSAANAKTGAGDSDLTGAVGTLIDGYGQGSHSPTISVAANGVITASCGGSSATHTLSSSDDADFIAGNIKDGVTLFGLLGTLSGGGSNVPNVISVTEITHTENWTSDSLGNAKNFADTYCNYTDSEDNDLYICYVTGNTAASRRADYVMRQRSQSVTVRDSTNTATGIGSGRSLYITAGSKVTVIKMKGINF